MASIGLVGPWLLTCWGFSNFPSLEKELSQNRVTVRKAPTGAALLVQAENNPPPSLILLSAGYDLVSIIGICCALKKNKITENIPICVLLSGDVSVNRLEIFKSGVVEILEIPWGVQEINLRLSRYFRMDNAHCSYADGADLQPPLSQKQILVWAARQILEFSSGSLPTQRELARQLGTTEDRLNVAFRNVLGLSVYEYLRMQTLRGALRLLGDKRLRVLEIAELCGYSDTASFTTAFRKLMGMPPTAYRKSRLCQN